MKHNNELEWLVNSPITYKAALKNHWLEFCANHMKKLIDLQKKYYTFLECELISMHFKTAGKWKDVHIASWRHADAEGWIVSKKGQRPKLKEPEEKNPKI